MNEHLSAISFASLNLAPQLLANIENLGFEYCTPIQAQSLPISLAGGDVAGQAQTGTGKSAAFLIAIIERILQRPNPQAQPAALVIAPTRELAIQIEQDALALSQNMPISVAVAYGGSNYEQQRQQIGAGVDILIGTPGRLIDYLKQQVYSLNNLHTVVLDEADRMFDLGFVSDMRYILRRCPAAEQRLSMLFSATLSHRVQELAYEYMHAPQLVKIAAKQVTAERVEQLLYQPANSEKIALLLGLYQQLKPARSMVFANTKRNAEQVHAYLNANGIKAALLSGDVPQKKRMRMLASFANGELNALVGTDVASRGLHIDAVSHVFNFDLPQSGEDYVHRIGRTARAGTAGMAISFACEDTAFNLIDIEEYIKSSIARASISDALLVEVNQPQASSAKRRAGSKIAQHKNKRAKPQRAAPPPASRNSSNSSNSSNRRRRNRQRNPVTALSAPTID